MSEEKKKALELIEKFKPHVKVDKWGDTDKYAKQCALICVDKIIEDCQWRADVYANELGDAFASVIKFWKKIRKEIKKA